MLFKTTLLAGAAALAFTLPAFAESIMVHDPYARASSNMAQSGAAFMQIMNMGDADDRLVSVASDIATRVELHTHVEDDNGVMRMMEVEEGFVIPAGETHALARGGDHVMFMGLTEGLEQGDEVNVTLVFEQAGEIEVTIPVDNERMPMHGGHGNHGAAESN